MIRDNDFCYINEKKYIRQSKSTSNYFIQIKQELRDIERKKQRLDYLFKNNCLSQEEKVKEENELNKEILFWKDELNHIQNPQRKFKKKYEKKSKEKIREEILKIIEEKKVKKEEYLHLTNLTNQLNVKEKYIVQVLDSLNKEGIVSQPIHHIPHDCYRPDTSCWKDDIYKIYI